MLTTTATQTPVFVVVTPRPGLAEARAALEELKPQVQAMFAMYRDACELRRNFEATFNLYSAPWAEWQRQMLQYLNHSISALDAERWNLRERQLYAQSYISYLENSPS